MKPWLKHAICLAAVLLGVIVPWAYVSGSHSNGLVAGVFAISWCFVLPVLSLLVGVIAGTDCRRMWMFPAIAPILMALVWPEIVAAALVVSLALGYAAMALGAVLLKRRNLE